MKTWNDVFAPVAALGRDHREGQAQLGQAIIKAFDQGTSLIGSAPVGVGKSFATIIPMMVAILDAKKENKSKRGIVSTETLSLQNQIAFKDLPFLSELYPGLDYKILKGRSNYLCLNIAKVNGLANADIYSLYNRLDMARDRLTTGEKHDVESIIGRELSAKEFGSLTSTSVFCLDNKCEAEDCYAAKARAKALAADIVVVNHALLQTDMEMKGSFPDADGLLGVFDFLVVDEAHTLADVLVSGWTETLNEWEINDYSNSVVKGVDKAKNVTPDAGVGKLAHDAGEDLSEALALIQAFFEQLSIKKGEDWKGSSHAVSEKYIVGNMSNYLTDTMNGYENDVPVLLVQASDNLDEVRKFLRVALAESIDRQIGGKREMSKGIRACGKLIDLIDTLLKAISSKNGIVFNYGINYGVILDGWVRKRDSRNMSTLRFIPLDISSKAAELWKGHSNVLVSGTIADLATGSFDYVKASLGYPPCDTLTVDSPFDFANRQLIYLTKKEYEAEEGTQFSLDELAKLLSASKGRALVLFTSKRELQIAAEGIRYRMSIGQVPWFNLYVQDDEADKQRLANAFRDDTHSCLFGLKSFFTGVDFPGETLSLATAVRFPLPRYSIECRMQMEIWAKKGFSDWYSHKALEDFQQIVGRLIRSTNDKGVFALLDQRVMNVNEKVYKTAKVGIGALGSPITQNLDHVEAFLS